MVICYIFNDFFQLWSTTSTQWLYWLLITWINTYSLLLKWRGYYRFNLFSEPRWRLWGRFFISKWRWDVSSSYQYRYKHFYELLLHLLFNRTAFLYELFIEQFTTGRYTLYYHLGICYNNVSTILYILNFLVPSVRHLQTMLVLEQKMLLNETNRF